MINEAQYFVAHWLIPDRYCVKVLDQECNGKTWRIKMLPAMEGLVTHYYSSVHKNDGLKDFKFFNQP